METTSEAGSPNAVYLTPKEAAEKKGVSVAAIYKAIERGQLSSERVLNRVAVRTADIDAWQPAGYTKEGTQREGVKKERGRSGGRPFGSGNKTGVA